MRFDAVVLRLVNESGPGPRGVAELIRAWHARGVAIAVVFGPLRRPELEPAAIASLATLYVAAEPGEPADEARLLQKTVRELDGEFTRTLFVADAGAPIEAAVHCGFAAVVGFTENDADRGALTARGAEQVLTRIEALEALIEPGTLPASALPLALDRGLLELCLGRERPIILLDFDGTLAPIVDAPDAATMSDGVRRAVRALAALCTVGIVSGRDGDDLMGRVAMDDLFLAGSHGFEIRSPNGERFTPEEAKPALPELAQAESRLRTELAGIEGLVIERKAVGLALHYRLASDEDAARAIRFVNTVARESNHLTTHADLRVIELRPAVDWHKGRAVRSILSTLASEGRDGIPVYVGDGATDEDAFLELRERGLGVLVGTPRRPTHAHARLDHQREVEAFLQTLAGFLHETAERTGWTLRFDDYQPEREPWREALSTLGNGKVATRGAAEESSADDTHYPGTYLAGGYNRMATEVGGEVLINEDLVNWPNWLRLSFRPDGGEWLSLRLFELLAYDQELDLRHGVLRRWLRVRDRDGRETSLVTRRFVSMADPSVAAVHWTLVAENWSGTIEFRSGLDGTVVNAGVARYRALRGQHLTGQRVTSSDGAIFLTARARQSRIELAQAARTRLFSAGRALAFASRVADHGELVDQHLCVQLERGHALDLEKVVLLRSSRDVASSSPIDDVRSRIDALPAYDALLRDHERRWAALWRSCDIELVGASAETGVLRLHVFHILQVVSPHIIHADTGVPARGLHGEAYRGHVFWDELFILPFLNLRLPALSRALLLYRYRRLPAARALARAEGYRGALFPWQSGSDGREETQRLHLNPASGRWLPDETHRQRHISAAVAWNVWQYYEATSDRTFLAEYGAELIVEVARFWASIAEWDAELARYRIRGVVGPDEFHTRYPGSDQPGLDDNTYTNVMAAWCLRCAERALAALGEEAARSLLDSLEVSDAERARFQEVASKLRVVFHDGHILSQFDGYDRLAEFDWEGYRKRYPAIERLDRLLEAEGDSADHYKASKQADVLMLFFLFKSDELCALLHTMGYAFEPTWIVENIRYYLRRTSHGSSLSRTLHAWVLAEHDRARSFDLFREALRADVADASGGTTHEGIHLGAMAGTLDLVQRGYTGAAIRGGVLWLDPRLPDAIDELKLTLCVHGKLVDLRITRTQLELRFDPRDGERVRIGLNGRVHTLDTAESSFPLTSARA